MDRAGISAGVTDPAESPGPDATVAGTLAPSVAARARPDVQRGTEVGRYLILQPIGRGATGEVWAAYDSDLDRKVAIKIVAEPLEGRPDRRRRLLGEAQAMAKIRHPNVVFVHDVGSHGGHLYIAMEFVEGTTLSRWCRARRRTRAELLDAFTAAARGLAAAHAAGLVHRDFKPDNVLVGDGGVELDGRAEAVHAAGRVRVADFGLAEAIVHETPTESADPRSAPRIAGTPAYMSPEHHAGDNIDARSDQFSFCVALFEALWGHRPFRGANLVELAAATIAGDVDASGGDAVPARIRRVVLRGLARRPEDRHRSMDDLIAALDRARRRRPAIAIAVGAGTLALAAMLWRIASPDHQPGDPCSSGAARAREVWNGPVDRIQLANGGLSDSFARGAERRVAQVLDRYAEAWAPLHDEACRAHASAQADGGSAVERTACVEDRLAAFAGLVTFATTRSITAESADGLVATLPSLEECRAVDGSSWLPVPADPQLGAEVAQLRARLRDAGLRWAADDPGDLLGEAQGLVADARATEYSHVIAQALHHLARIENEQGRTDDATHHVDEALGHAVRGGHDRLAAVIVVHLLEQIAENPGLDRDADRWARLGEALLERAGGADEIAADLHATFGSVLFNRGEYDAALVQLEQAEQDDGRVYGLDDHRAAVSRMGQAMVLAQLARVDEAVARANSARQVIEQAFGRDHPNTIRALHENALIEGIRGDRDRSLTMLIEALERLVELRGERDREVSNTAFNVAMLLATRGRIDEARERLSQSRRAWPPEGDPFADAQFEEAETAIAYATGAFEDAITHNDRAIAGFAASGPQHERSVASARLDRAVLLVKVRRYAEALADLERGFADAGGTPSFTASMMSSAVIAAHALGDHAVTALWLARAEGQSIARPDDEILIAFARTVARGERTAAVLERTRRDRDRLVSLTFADDPWVRAMNAWLAG